MNNSLQITVNIEQSLNQYLFKVQAKIQGQNEEMLYAACQQFMGKTEAEIQDITCATLEGHQRSIMGCMTVEV